MVSTRSMPIRNRVADSSPDAPKPRVGFTVQPTIDNAALVLTFHPPHAPRHEVDHAPCEIVLVIDVSGSMQVGAPPPDGGESTGLSILDLTKHAAKTIVAALNDGDRLGLVTFSNEAKVVQRSTAMTPEAKKEVVAKIESLRCEQATNLWAGLRKGLQTFEGAADEVSRTRAMFVLTDGQPNHMCPAKGYIPALQPLLDQEVEAGRPPVQINTFGFGYSIRSGLLLSLAEMSGGTYGFIPDCGMIGTVFINATANLFATFATNACLQLHFPKGQTVEVLGGLKHETEQQISKHTVSIPMGSLLYAQPRDIVLDIDPAVLDMLKFDATLQYFADNTRVSEHLTGTDFDDTLYPLSRETSLYTAARARMCNILIELFPEGFDGERRAAKPNALDDTILQLNFLVDGVRQSPAYNDELVKSLLSDLVGDAPTGQIMLALSNTEYYKRWGQHYLPSILGAHQKQQCNSFKDRGPLQYGKDSKMFTRARDRLNDIFDNMEIKSYATEVLAAMHAGHPMPAGQKMRAGGPFFRKRSHALRGSLFNDADGKCFAGSCHIQMAGENGKRLDNLELGDLIESQNGSRRVVGILKTEVSDLEMVQLDQLVVTPWHPICRDSTWSFPVQLPHRARKYTGFIYSLLLEPSRDPSQHTAIVEGTVCTTLGHGILDKHASNDVRGHELFGDYERMRDYLGLVQEHERVGPSDEAAELRLETSLTMGDLRQSEVGA